VTADAGCAAADRMRRRRQNVPSCRRAASPPERSPESPAASSGSASTTRSLSGVSRDRSAPAVVNHACPGHHCDDCRSTRPCARAGERAAVCPRPSGPLCMQVRPLLGLATTARTRLECVATWRHVTGSYASTFGRRGLRGLPRRLGVLHLAGKRCPACRGR
jgi:hypothetical protein